VRAFARQDRRVLSLAPYLLLLLTPVVPRVEDPLPETIGIPAVFALAGAGGVLASIFCAGSPQAKHDRWVRRGGVIGFGVGFALYLIAVVVQVAFSK
jgi:hypothetical protein